MQEMAKAKEIVGGKYPGTKKIDGEKTNETKQKTWHKGKRCMVRLMRTRRLSYVSGVKMQDVAKVIVGVGHPETQKNEKKKTRITWELPIADENQPLILSTSISRDGVGKFDAMGLVDVAQNPC